jgi:hypothetical protein
MKTPSEQSSTSQDSDVNTAPPPEDFRPPEITSLASLTDGRSLAEYRSAYPAVAWVQIIAELIYLLIVLVAAFVALVLLAKYVVLKESSGLVFSLVGDPRNAAALIVYSAVALAGICGGCSSSLKWLYHSVAKKRWHRDRFIWRIIVPPLSGIFAVFTALMIISGIVPFLNKASLAGPASGAALGFFVGFFSDNLLAALEKVAARIFGTMDPTTPANTPSPDQQETSAPIVQSD